MAACDLRRGVRGIILDERDRVLLLRMVAAADGARGGSLVVWAPPGGGIERGETAVRALRRELAEETGFSLLAEPPLVWRQEVRAPDIAPGHAGVAYDYFLVRAASFTPRGSLSDDVLAGEGISDWRWWTLPDVAGYRGTELFSPRDFATPLASLIAHGAPATPVLLGR